MVSYKREFEIILYAVNAKRPISVTDSGMVIEESDVQLVVFVYHFISINYVLNGRKVKT